MELQAELYNDHMGDVLAVAFKAGEFYNLKSTAVKELPPYHDNKCKIPDDASTLVEQKTCEIFSGAL